MSDLMTERAENRAAELLEKEAEHRVLQRELRAAIKRLGKQAQQTAEAARTFSRELAVEKTLPKVIRGV